MKLFIFIILLPLSACENPADKNSQSQNSTKVELTSTQDSTLHTEDDSIYTVVDQMPLFGNCDLEKQDKSYCDRELIEYMISNLKYNPISKENGIESKIIATFIVEKDGTISNLEMKRGGGISNIEEVIEGMPIWRPGRLRGEVKRVRFHLPMHVNLQ